MHKKGHKLKTSPLIKNPQFSSNLANIQTKLPTHEVLIILTKFHKDWKKIVDFLLTQKFLVCALFYASLFIQLQCGMKLTIYQACWNRFQKHSSERRLQPHRFSRTVVVKPHQYFRPSYPPVYDIAGGIYFVESVEGFYLGHFWVTLGQNFWFSVGKP